MDAMADNETQVQLLQRFPRLTPDACAELVGEVITMLDRRLMVIMPIARAEERCDAMARLLDALATICRDQGAAIAEGRRSHGG